ncbi:hypothetical protein N8Z79_07440 [Crocinitomicaceae bacterium]|nr:hypothetical protein [Crocinitomicaceae bacterium]
MKFFITVVAVFIFQRIHAQSDTNHVLCDKVVMNDGSVEIVQIQEVKRNKVIYVLCCEDCAVPREFKRKNIDTLIYNPKHRIATEVSIEKPKLVELKTDPYKYFEVGIDGYKRAIYQGKKVTIKIDTMKYRGVFGIINDSTISVDNNQFALSEIDMISKPKTGKTIGLIIASLPIHLTGLIMIGFAYDGPYLYATGPALIGGSTTAVIIESRTGKRYPRFKIKKDGSVIQKWNYAIESL